MFQDAVTNSPPPNMLVLWVSIIIPRFTYLVNSNFPVVVLFMRFMFLIKFWKISWQELLGKQVPLWQSGSLSIQTIHEWFQTDKHYLQKNCCKFISSTPFWRTQTAAIGLRSSNNFFFDFVLLFVMYQSGFDLFSVFFLKFHYGQFWHFVLVTSVKELYYVI